MSTLLRRKLRTISGPRENITLYGDGNTGFHEDRYNAALKHIVDLLDREWTRGEKRRARQPALMDMLRQHSEWAELSAYRIYELTTVNVQKIQKVMASDEFKEWKASLKEGVTNG